MSTFQSYGCTKIKFEFFIYIILKASIIILLDSKIFCHLLAVCRVCPVGLEHNSTFSYTQSLQCLRLIISTCCYSQGFDTRNISSLRNRPIPRKAPSILPVLWSPFWFPQIKLNTYSLSKGNPDPATCERVFKNCHGLFLGGFSQ